MDAPKIGPQAIPASNLLPKGDSGETIGLFCLNPVRFSPPKYISKFIKVRVICPLRFTNAGAKPMGIVK